MSDEELVNIARLMTTYNLEIEQLPNNLKCTQCKLVLKDACQIPCGCTYCRACVDIIISRGYEFCPGDSEECGEIPLSQFTADFKANKSVSRLGIKCPHDGCLHECQLSNIKEHLRECPRKNDEWSFRELGFMQEKLNAEQIGGHLLPENRRNRDILLEIIANINREIEKLKQRDEVSRREIKTLKHELVLKDNQIKSIMDQMIHVQNENESIKNHIKSIKEEKEDLAGRVRILTKKIEQEIAERRENDELDSARVIEHVDREIAAVKQLIGSNRTQMQLMTGEIGSISQHLKLLEEIIYSVKLQVESIQPLVELGQGDARFELSINNDVGNSIWFAAIKDEYFYGEVHQYKYRLESWNRGMGADNDVLVIQLRIHASLNDGQLPWPFVARVVITVSDRDRRETCKTISQQCHIERPPDIGSRRGEPFVFFHSELIKAGINISRGVRVSCVIYPFIGR